MDEMTRTGCAYETRLAVEDAIRTAASPLAVSVNDLHGEELREYALRALAAATAARKVADNWVAWMSDEARNAGASWQDIGDAVGTTRQAAQMRFGK